LPPVKYEPTEERKPQPPIISPLFDNPMVQLGMAPMNLNAAMDAGQQFGQTLSQYTQRPGTLESMLQQNPGGGSIEPALLAAWQQANANPNAIMGGPIVPGVIPGSDWNTMGRGATPNNVQLTLNPNERGTGVSPANAQNASLTPDPNATTARLTPEANYPMGIGQNNPNEPAPMANQYNRTQDAANKNRSLAEQAAADNDAKEMKRLDDEWARLISTPQFKAMYGQGDELATKQRLINSYMQPGNDAAESSMDRAAGKMISDDIWAAEMDKANAWGPDPGRMWVEHWNAMNKGGRDPLEGHPAAVQAIQAKRAEMENLNQQASYDALTKWMTNATT
jgi:hypothetical protein